MDGIALVDFTGDRAVLSRLFANRVPVVMASCWADYADSVAVDDQAGVGLAVDHLVELGHQRIGYVGDEFMDASTKRSRAAAFERALLRHGLEPRGEWKPGRGLRPSATRRRSSRPPTTSPCG